MADLEARVCAVLEAMVNAAVTEMTKVIGGADAVRPQAASCAAEDTHGSSVDKVHAGGYPARARFLSCASRRCRPDNRPSIEIEALAASSG